MKCKCKEYKSRLEDLFINIITDKLADIGFASAAMLNKEDRKIAYDSAMDAIRDSVECLDDLLVGDE